MAGYIRQDITNNIADGNVINASDFDNEYNAIEAAFHATTGHTHDGTSAEGAAITKIGPTQDVVASTIALTPKTDNTIDLGSSTLEYKDLFIDGTANIDSLVADTADINAGTIDGVTIGGAVRGAGSFTTLDANGNTALGDVVGDLVTINGTTTFVNAAPTLTPLTASQAVFTNGSKTLVSNAITGTGNVVMSASPTLTGTISAAAATLSSDLTLNGGTANGVLYLNGSKVATSGSALTFDGSTFYVNGNQSLSGAGTGTRYVALLNETNSYAGALALQAGGGSAGFGGGITMYGASHASYPGAVWVGYSSGTSTGIIFGQGGNGVGTEQMRLTSTGLGIGTSSPSFKLDVQSTGATTVGRFRTGSTLTSTIVDFGRTDQAVNAAIAYDGTGFIRFGTTTAHNLTLMTGAVDRVTLDSSGNLGIGTSSPAGKLQVSSNNPEVYITDNSVSAPDSGALYLGIGAVPQYAGLIADFSNDRLNIRHNQATRATFDASGNLGLGVTPSAWNTITALQVKNAAFGGFSSTAYIGTNWYYASGDKYIASTGATLYTQDGNTSSHIWYNAPSGTAGAAISFTQAMTLDASGNLGVGTTSTSGLRLAVDSGATTIAANFNSTNADGVYIRFQNSGTSIGDIGSGRNAVSGGAAGDFGISSRSGALVLGTSSTERARITSGGYSKASNNGTYLGGTGSYHEFRSSVDEFTQRNSNTNATTPYGYYIQYTAAAPNGTGSQFLYCEDNVALRAEIRSNGGLANYSGNDVNLSDRREKTNFAPAKSYLDTICAIPVQTFEYIDQSEDDPGLTLGVVAQDVQAVAPELVMESNWGTEDEPKMRLSIYQTDLQYALMKCIQELKAQNDELRARVAVLEAQP